MNGYSFYYPEDGEEPDDARPSELKRVFGAECVAEEACEHDYHHCDGWERMEHGSGFSIAVICPDGSEVRFTGIHEPSVEHRVYPAEVA